MFFPLIFLLTITRCISLDEVNSTTYCNYISNPLSPSQLISSYCAFYLGRFSYNSIIYLICVGTSKSTIDFIDITTNNKFKTISPISKVEFTSTDSCIQMFGGYINSIVCSRKLQLTVFDVINQKEVGKGFLETNTWKDQLPKFKPLSENLDSFIAIEDGYKIKIVDVVKGTEIKIFGGDQ